MGNKTEDRPDVHDLWMTDFFNFNKGRQAFAQHPDQNATCQIYNFRPRFDSVAEQIQAEFVSNYTYDGMTEIPWETTAKT